MMVERGIEGGEERYLYTSYEDWSEARAGVWDNDADCMLTDGERTGKICREGR